MYERFLCFFTDTATTEIYTLSLHDALPILFGGTEGTSGHTFAVGPYGLGVRVPMLAVSPWSKGGFVCSEVFRSEEHTSELRSLRHLVCRLLLEKKKKSRNAHSIRRDWLEHW